MGKLIKLSTEPDENGNILLIGNKTKKNYLNLRGMQTYDAACCVCEFMCKSGIWSENDHIVQTAKPKDYVVNGTEYQDISYCLKFYEAKIKEDERKEKQNKEKDKIEKRVDDLTDYERIEHYNFLKSVDDLAEHKKNLQTINELIKNKNVNEQINTSKKLKETTDEKISYFDKIFELDNRTDTLPRMEVKTSNKKSSTNGIPTFKINLDLPARQRWTEVSLFYKDKIDAAIKEAEQMLGTGTLAWVVENGFTALTHIGGIMYSEELKGIAEVLNQPVGKVALLQLAYESSTCCTSIVTNGPDGKPIHFRSMDWTMPSLMPLTLNVQFMKDNKIVFTGTTWCGYVGLLTGMRHDGYAISINYRRCKDGSLLSNLWSAVTSCFPISFLVREVLETFDNYKDAVTALTKTDLIAPCYITVSGINRNEGTIITRNRYISENPLVLNSNNPFIIQTNNDHWGNDDSEFEWQDIEFSRLRRKFVSNYLNPKSNPTNSDMWNLMDSVPIESFDTLYKTGMSAGSNYYETKGRANNYPFGDTSYINKFKNLGADHLTKLIDY
jgi:N-acylethanolamine-hydrolysing acid amidase